VRNNILCGLKPTLQKLTNSPRDEPGSRTRRTPNIIFSTQEFKRNICPDASATLESFSTDAHHEEAMMATLEEILKLDPMSQVSDPKKSTTVASPNFQIMFRLLKRVAPDVTPSDV
jgi:hypothetical protein